MQKKRLSFTYESSIEGDLANKQLPSEIYTKRAEPFLALPPKLLFAETPN